MCQITLEAEGRFGRFPGPFKAFSHAFGTYGQLGMRVHRAE